MVETCGRAQETRDASPLQQQKKDRPASLHLVL